MTIPLRHPAARYGLAVLAVAIAAVLTRILWAALNPLLFPLFFASVAVSAWYGGAMAGLMATVLSVLAVQLDLDDPLGTIVWTAESARRIAVFFPVALLIVGLAAGRDRAVAARLRVLRWYEGTLASIGDAVVATDTERRVVFLNAVAEALTGWPRNEALGRPVDEVVRVVPEDGGAALEETAARVLREGDSVELINRCRLVARDGRSIPIDESGSPIREADGTVVGAVLVFRDVSRRRQQELALRRSEERHRLATAATAGMVYDWDVSTGLVTRSAGVRELTGFSAEECGSGVAWWSSLVVPEDYDAMWGRVRRALESGAESFALEYRIRRRDGGIVHVWDRGLIVRDGVGRAVRVVGNAVDVTARRVAEEALRESVERLGLALEAGRVGAWEWEIPTDRVVWSDRVYEIHGLEPDSFGGHVADFVALIHADDRASVQEAINAALERDRPYQIDFRCIRPDGEVRWLTTRALVIRDASGHPRRMLGTVIDITERRAAEEDLRRARDQAEEATRARDRFLAMLSHELRTPLTPVLLAVSALLDERLGPDEQRSYLEMIRQNVGLEARLIDDLLDVMRVMQGKMTLRLEATRLHELVGRALEICRPELEAKGLQLVLRREAPDPVVRADPARMQQVLWNLVKNAVKFTPEGGTVTVTTRDGSAGRVVVSVADTGRGIDAAALERIFNAFEQGEHGVTHEYGGLGLGLTISRSIVEAHGGTLAATSEGPGRGAMFTVELATAPEPVVAASPEDSNGQSSSPGPSLRIMLVEDDRMTARILTKLLREQGHSVTAASTLVEALKVAESGYDLLISDLGLPDGSGLELMQRLGPRRPPVGIALSGFGMEDDVRRSLEAGFAVHLTKPIEFAKLQAVIRDVARSTALAPASP